MRVSQMLKREISTLPKDIGSRSDAKNIAILVEFKDGTFHHILPDKPSVAQELVNACAEYIGNTSAIKDPKPAADSAPVEPDIPSCIVFRNRQAIGDILCMTAAVRDFKKAFPAVRVGVSTVAMHLWDNNPHIDHSFSDASFIKDIGPGFGTNRSNAWNIHLIDAFRLDMENKLSVKIQKGDLRPDIWLTKAEHKRRPLIDGPYWIIAPGGAPGWPTKQYHRWQEVVNALKDRINFVQIGAKGNPWPLLDGVVDFIGKTEDRQTGVRDLFNLFLHAQGSIGLVSMHMHLSAAFGSPCVVVAGAREPAWFTHYFGHQYISTNGTLRCGLHSSCWACKIEGCKYHAEEPKAKMIGLPVPKCVDIIEPEEVAEAVLKYYKGGRLKFGKKLPNSFFKNIVEEPKTFSVPKVESSDEEIVKQTGMSFGGGSLTDRDWLFIKSVVAKFDIGHVLEFGAGLSTVMLGSVADSVLTFETSEGWIKKVSALVDPKVNTIRHWDGKNFPGFCGVNFDFAFVDGPSGGQSREVSTKVASELANIIIIHDAGREPERRWQKMYLEENFKMISKGGHRCHLWIRKSDKEKAFETEKASAEEAKRVRSASGGAFREAIASGRSIRETIKICTTCRGYGGSERSTIFLMKMFLENGNNVELVPTGKISREYASNMPNGVVVREWESLKEPCRIVLLYCSDTIWNYNNEQYADTMPSIAAERKVMVVNFKVGAIGQAAWTKGWDKYLFLNDQHRVELLARMPQSKTKVLPPPTDLSKFFENDPDYRFPLRLIRHSSQGDSKHHPDTNRRIKDILGIDSNIQFYFMPAKSDCIDHPNVFKHQKNVPVVDEFLKLGNCMLYALPDGYTEGGPRVIMESMAAGLPVICDDHSGPHDRVTSETGWLCRSWNDYLDAVKGILNDPEMLRSKGLAARERARAEFVPERWLEEIEGEK